jgi:uncharacterized protein (DUF697 family)
MTKTLTYLRRERESRNLVLDYALGVSIIGLLPIAEFLTLKLLITLGLISKMIWDIGVKWEFSRGQDILAIMGYLFGCLGAFAMAFMAWLTLLGIGLFIPYIGGFKIAATLFTFTWMLGQATHQFFAIGQKRKIIRRTRDES